MWHLIVLSQLVFDVVKDTLLFTVKNTWLTIRFIQYNVTRRSIMLQGLEIHSNFQYLQAKMSVKGSAFQNS